MVYRSVGLALLAVGATSSPEYPSLKALLEMKDEAPDELARQISKEFESQQFKFEANDLASAEQEQVLSTSTSRSMPVVMGHGMGDSCFNAGFASITKLTGQLVNNFATCIPTGSTQASDTTNGFLLGIEQSIDRFAEGIWSHPELKNGFDAVGLSQGNSLIRGYIQKYNNPPVHRWLSIHGTVMGVAAVPGCADGKGFSLCKAVSHWLANAELAYSSLGQNHIFQAGYLRDPVRVDTEAYKKHSVIGRYNNEGDVVNSTYKDNFIKTEKFVMVEAEQDTMVEPKEGEHWGLFDSKFNLLSMNQTELYTKDLFGLKTVDQQGKISFEHTSGNHLQFTTAQFRNWVAKYLTTATEGDSTVVV